MKRLKANYNRKKHGNYVVVDKNIIKRTDLSATAKVLYVFLAGWNAELALNNKSLGEKLGYSERTMLRANKELVAADLYYVHRNGAKSYTGYLGNSHISARQHFANVQQGNQ